MTPELPPLDPVEALMITVGLKAIISRKVEKFSKSKLREAGEIAVYVADLAKTLVAGELRPTNFGTFNYHGTLKDLARGWEPEQVEEMMAQFPPEIGIHTTGLVVRSKAIVNALITDYPQTNYVTATGSINLVPADKKIFKFVQVLEVLCDPLSIFGLMSEGALLKTQAAIVRKVYPSLSALIDAALLDATVKAKADRKSFELDPRAEIGVRAWFDKGPLSDGGLQKAQDSVAKANQRKEAASAPPGGANLPRAQQTLSQRVETQT